MFDGIFLRFSWLKNKNMVQEHQPGPYENSEQASQRELREQQKHNNAVAVKSTQQGNKVATIIS